MSTGSSKTSGDATGIASRVAGTIATLIAAGGTPALADDADPAEPGHHHAALQVNTAHQGVPLSAMG
jgi:hypothetical protein